MAKLSKRPNPECPICESKSSRITSTNYTNQGEFVRTRVCSECDYTFNTIQESEVVMSREDWVISYPTRSSFDHIHKIVQVRRRDVKTNA